MAIDFSYNPEKQASGDIDFSYNPAAGGLSARAKKQNKGFLADTATDAKRGIEQLPGMATGLVDLVNPLTYVTGKRMADEAANWVGEKTGFQPSKWEKQAAEEYSPERKASDKAINDAWENGSASDIAGSYLSNPRSIAGVIGQSAPSMIAGGGIARLGLKSMAAIGGTDLAALRASAAAGDVAAADKLNRLATTAGAVGEGAVTAGQNMDQVSRDVDPALAAGTSLAAGAITGLIGKTSGRVANKLGIPDFETSMAGGGAGTGSMSLSKRIAAGATQEGLLQEAPQSAQEQMWQNVAEGKPLGEGVARQAVEGTLAGIAMGGGIALRSGNKSAPKADDTKPAAEEVPPAALGLTYQPGPAMHVFPDGTTMTGAEYQQHQDNQEKARLDGMIQPIPATPEQVKALGYMPGTPLVVFPDGTAMTRAEFEQDRANKEQGRLDSMIQPADPEPKLQETGPMSSAVNVGVDSGATSLRPQGSFSDMSEFANLLGQEQQDVQSRRTGIAGRQALQREVALRDADQRVADQMAKEAAQRRRAVLDQVLSDPTTQNPADRFAAELQRQGFRDSTPTADELATVQRFNDIRAAEPAGPEIEPSLPNELDAEQLGIRSRKGSSGAQSSGRDKVAEVRQLVADGWKISNKTLVSPTGKKRILNTAEHAAAKEATRERNLAAMERYRQSKGKGTPVSTTNVASEETNAPEIEQLAPQTPQANDAQIESQSSSAPQAEGVAQAEPAEAAPVVDQSEVDDYGKRVVRRKKGNEARDDLVGAIMRVTGGNGVAASMSQTITGDTANRASKVRGLFTNNGTMDLDDIANDLRTEEGYDVRDGNHLAELIREQAAGNPVYSMERNERDAAANEEKKQKDAVLKQANELGLKGVGGKRTLAVVEAEIAKEEARLNQLEKEAERKAIQAADAIDSAIGADMTKADFMRWLSDDIANTYTQEEIKRAEQDQADRADAKAQASAIADAEERAQSNSRQGNGDQPAAPQGGRVEEGARSTEGERLNADSNLPAGTTVVDGDGNQYRVYYHRNHLVVAHPIVDGKADVNADTTVRFWVTPNRIPSGESDRTDPIYRAAEGFDLAKQTNKQAAEQFAQQNAPESDQVSKEQVDRERDAVPFSMQQQSQPKPQGRQTGLFTADGRVSSKAKQSKQDEKGVAMFSRADSSALETAKRRMDKFVTEFENGTLKDSDTQILGSTPTVLQLLGASDIPLQIDGETLRKIINGKHKYGMSADIVRGLPDGIYDPLIVFDSPNQQTGKPGKIIVTESVDKKGDPVIAAIHLGKVVGRFKINDISSAYGLEDFINRNKVEPAKLQYVRNKEGLAASTTPSLLKLAGVVQKAQDLGINILTEADVVKDYGSRFSFAGRSAATADQFALSNAEKRIEAGDDAEEVRKETGWFKGADGKWRFEIDDSDAKLKKPYPENGMRWGDMWLYQIKAGGNSNVGNMLDHPSLFAAYPSLADMAVSTKKGTGASLSVESRQIDIGEDVPMYEVASVLLHEIQHGIQIIEGFAMGGSAKQFESRENSIMAERDVINAVTKARNRIEYFGETEEQALRTVANNEGRDLSKMRHFHETYPGQELDARYKESVQELGRSNAMDRYKRLAGEVEARNVQSRQPMTAEQRRERSPSSTQDVSDSDVIVIFNGKVMQDAPMPANASRGQGSGMAFRDLQAVVDRISKGFNNLPKIHVLDSPRDLSDRRDNERTLKEQIEQAGAMDDVEGAHHNGEIYLFASGIASEERAEHVLATHEITHYGLRGTMGKGLDSALQNIWLHNKEIRAKAAVLRTQLGLSSNVSAVEEVLAEMKDSDLVKLKGWRKMVQAFRDWAHKAGFDRIAAKLDGLITKGMSDQEKADLFVANMVNAARDWVRNGKPARGYDPGTSMLGDANFSAKKSDVTDTPAFRKWFGDSKVVDADGKPLVVYHGTKNDFTTFLPDSHFGTKEQADTRLDDLRGKVGKNVMPVYLSIQKMKRVKDQEIAQRWADVVATAKRQGYDGLIYKNEYEGDGTQDSYVVFKPEQVKSASGNNGNFDASNPDIRFSRNKSASVDASITEIFDGLAGRGLKKVRAEERLAEHPQAESIRYVQDNILDILEELEGAGTIKINC